MAPGLWGRVQPDKLQGEGERAAGGEQPVHQPHPRGGLQRLQAPLRPVRQLDRDPVPRIQKLQNCAGAVVVHSRQQLPVLQGERGHNSPPNIM